MKISKQIRSRAAKLIAQLKELSDSSEFDEIALALRRGPIYAWQLHNLANLELALANGEDVEGFLGVKEENGRIHVTAWPLPETEEPDMGDLLTNAKEILVMARLGPDEDDFEENWNEH